MKKIIPSLFTALFLCAGAYAQAQSYGNFCEETCCEETCGGFYAEVLGGGNFIETNSRRCMKTDFDAGYIVSGSMGYEGFGFAGLRLEAEYAYRRNTLDKVRIRGVSTKLHGHFQSSSYMANLIWDFPLASWGYSCWNLKPFAGFGLGYDDQQIHGTNAAGMTVRDNKKDFAWQVMTGVAYNIFCNTDITLEYKFHQGGLDRLYNNSVGIGMIYRFGSIF